MRSVKRSDPAPSRLSYRLQRLRLTPLFRRAVRVGLPVAVGLGAIAAYLAEPSNRQMIEDKAVGLYTQVIERPEFMVNLMAIEGATETLDEDIRDVLGLDFPVSSFDLDLDTLRETVVGLDAVRGARVAVKSNVLTVRVDPRVPVLIWRSRDGLELIDATGVLVAPADSRADWPHLPVIAGDGAGDAVAEALALFTAARPIDDRLRGLERRGERRWDVVLDRGQRILLPVDAPVRALERVIALDGALDMLQRDILTVDMRLPDRPTVRISQPALREFWRITTIDSTESDDG